MFHPFRSTLTVFICLWICSNGAYAWRSSLYPENWTPTDKDAQGRFLHDFSYAGYQQGETPIPTNPPGSVYVVTNAPYFADNTGSSDATAAIQLAIDNAGAAGGGIVYLPAGTYHVAPGANSYALRIWDSGVVLRGAGTNQTFIRNTDTYMRYKNVIMAQPSTGDWHSPLGGSEILARSDIDYPTRTIPLVDVSGLSTGGTIIVRADCTDDFIADHGMTGDWSSGLNGPTFCRTITSIDPVSTNITINIPTRYYLKTRDNARIYKVAPFLEEVGVEDLSVGMVENTTPGWGDDDYAVNGTGAYEVHGSHAIRFQHVRHGWMQRVGTYRPSGNAGDYHALSNIILLEDSVHVTVRDCVVQKPRYEGGGGNGYGYTLRSGDCLITRCLAHHTRHNYDFKSMWTSGNVIHDSTGSSPRLSSDFHMHLSMANLFDSMTVSGGDYLQAVYRPYGTPPTLHGHSSTESIFWNTVGQGSGTAVQSAQWGWGYIIGTSGSQSGVLRGTANNSAPEDVLEGEGTGGTLEPQSLYDDQFAKRMQGVLPDAGSDQLLFVTNSAVGLDGSVYSYGYGEPNVFWSQIGGPTASFGDTNVLTTTVACTNEGTYTFRLTAIDGGKTNHDDIVITVLNAALSALTSKDYIVGESDGPALTYYPGGAGNQVGAGGALNDRTDRNVVLGYSLPVLDFGTTVTGATFNFEITHARDTGGTDPALHVYILNTADPDSSGTNLFYHGPSSSTENAKYVGEKYLAVDSTEVSYADDEQDITLAMSGDALVLLQDAYGGDHIPDQSEVFFRLNLSVDPTVLPSTQYNRYRIDLADDESMLIMQTTDPPPPGAIVWSEPMTLSVSSNQASVSMNVNTNLQETWLLWDTIDHGANTNSWPVTNRLDLGMQPAGVVTGLLTNLSADTRYYWRLYGESTITNGWSFTEELITAFSDAQAPSFTGASGLSAFSIQLNWLDNATNETGYILQRSTNAVSGYSEILVLSSNTTAYTDTGLLGATHYYYRLAATNSANGSVTDFARCQTNATTATLIEGALTSRDSVIGRRQANAPAFGYYPDAASGQAGVGGSGTTTSRYDRIPVFGFTLPTLPAGTTVSNAILNFEITGVRDDSARDPSLHAYILNTSNPDGSGTNFFYHGPSNTTVDATYVGSTFIDSPDGISTNFADDEHDQTYSISGDALTLLQSLYGGDHIPDQSEVFFRFNHSLVTLPLDGGGAYDRYFVDAALDESSLQITPTQTINYDTDDDGMPDDWEIDNFGSLTNSAGYSSDDWDGDGFSDLHEYLAGTSPTNGSSRLVVTSTAINLSTNNIVLTWQAVTGKTYMIVGSTNLIQGPWITNATDIIGSNPSCVHTVITEQATMFYRIRLQE